MAIKLNRLAQFAKQVEDQKTYLFKDLQLDISKNGEYNTVTGKFIEGNDIKASFNEQAIRNSIRNLFGTKPGQRFLFPKYGLNLEQFLFEPINEFNGQVIGDVIVRAIDAFEPRVRLEECKVLAKPDENLYDITIIVSLPPFRTQTSINTFLDLNKQSFVFLENQTNR